MLPSRGGRVSTNFNGWVLFHDSFANGVHVDCKDGKITIVNNEGWLQFNQAILQHVKKLVVELKQDIESDKPA